MSNRTLTEIALACGTDKAGHHNYTPIYDKYFSDRRNDRIVLLELGIGGYHYPDRGGQSLRMWHEYFPNAIIAGVDVHQKNLMALDRVKYYQASQDDHDGLMKIIDEIGYPDIIIDDASHINPLTLRSFEILFPVLKTGGIYVIEDIESSWGGSWCHGASDRNDFNFPSAVNLGRRLINDVNAPYVFGNEKQYDVNSIHFHKNLIFFFK